jgi:hypothetical protein
MLECLLFASAVRFPGHEQKHTSGISRSGWLNVGSQ